jgi:hypothetical protein
LFGIFDSRVLHMSNHQHHPLNKQQRLRTYADPHAIGR